MYQLQVTITAHGKKFDVRATLAEVFSGGHLAPLATRYCRIRPGPEIENRDPFDQVLQVLAMFAESELDPGIANHEIDPLF